MTVVINSLLGVGEPTQARTPTASPLLDSSVTQAESIPFTVSDKVIISGEMIEHFHFQKPIRAVERSRPRKKRTPVEMFSPNTPVVSPNRVRSARDSANRIRRLIYTNFSVGARFFTLTFSDKNPFSLANFDKCNYAFKKFIQRLKHSHPLARYLAVPEFQKRGAIHYHVIVDIPYIPQPELARIWGMGFVFIQQVRKTPNVAAYLTKYLRKNSDDPRFYGKKCYFASKGLIRPTVLYGNEARKILTSKNLQTTYENEYESLLNGTIHYKQHEITSPTVIS